MLKDKEIRITNEYICHDCGAKEGKIHEYGCDMEECPFCGGQLISCGCCYQKLNINVSKGTWAYYNGLTEEQQRKWIEILNREKRIPYIHPVIFCEHCGKLTPEFFHDDDWDKYVIPSLKYKVLCWDCYQKMKKIFPKGWRNVENKER